MLSERKALDIARRACNSYQSRFTKDWDSAGCVRHILEAIGKADKDPDAHQHWFVAVSRHSHAVEVVRRMKPPESDAMRAYWLCWPRDQGQIVEVAHPQVGTYEGCMGKCPDIILSYDRSCEAWRVEYGGRSLAGNGRAPSVIEAFRLLKLHETVQSDS